MATNNHKKMPAPQWDLRLYVAGQTARSLRTIESLQTMCETHLKGQYKIEVIDLMRNPKMAREDQILATPTLVRRLPPPLRKLIGELTNADRVLSALGLFPRTSAAW